MLVRMSIMLLVYMMFCCMMKPYINIYTYYNAILLLLFSHTVALVVYWLACTVNDNIDSFIPFVSFCFTPCFGQCSYRLTPTHMLHIK